MPAPGFRNHQTTAKAREAMLGTFPDTQRDEAAANPTETCPTRVNVRHVLGAGVRYEQARSRKSASR